MESNKQQGMGIENGLEVPDGMVNFNLENCSTLKGGPAFLKLFHLD